MNILRRMLILFTLVCAVAANAANNFDPNLAMQSLDLDAEQKTKFNLLIRGLVRDINKVSHTLSKRSHQMSPTDLQRRMRGKIRRLYKTLDEGARDIVREDQWDAYLVFKDAHYDDARRRGFTDHW